MTREYVRARAAVALFLGLTVLAAVVGERDGARWQRLLWPFSDMAMFTIKFPQPDQETRLKLVLLDGETRIPVSYKELLHPHSDVGEQALQFRMLHPGHWTAAHDAGLAAAARRVRCKRGLRADAVAVVAYDFTHASLLAGGTAPTGQHILRRVPLPEGCP